MSVQDKIHILKKILPSALSLKNSSNLLLEIQEDSQEGE